MTSPDRTLTSRFEFKYWLDPERVGQVRRSIQPFVRPDRFAAPRPGHRYALSSLYLDNPGFDCYRGTIEGHRNRFKLRIRTYSDDPEAPAFFEIKRRMDAVILKRRASVDRALVQRFLQGLPVSDPSSSASEFMQLTRRIGAGPVMRVRYEREAYESTGRDPVRVTFDTQLHHNATRSATLDLAGPGWRPTPMLGAILEIKFTGTCPSWVTRMVRSLSIERGSVPKYVLCVDAARACGTLRAGLPAIGR